MTKNFTDLKPMSVRRWEGSSQHKLPSKTSTGKGRAYKGKGQIEERHEEAPNENKTRHTIYKKLWNKITNKIREDRIQQNGEIIAKVKQEDEFWKIINED